MRRFVEAIGGTLTADDVAPPTFVATMLVEPPDFGPALEHGAGWLNGGDRFEHYAPIRAGDVLRSQSELVHVFEKQGASGRLLFLVFETTFDRGGTIVVKHIGTRVRR